MVISLQYLLVLLQIYCCSIVYVEHYYDNFQLQIYLPIHFETEYLQHHHHHINSNQFRRLKTFSSVAWLLPRQHQWPAWHFPAETDCLGEREATDQNTLLNLLWSMWPASYLILKYCCMMHGAGHKI